MKNLFCGILLTSSAVALLGAPAEAAANCSDLLGLKLAHAEVSEAEIVMAGHFKEPGPGRLGRDYSDLPAFCRVHGFSSPVQDSKIGFEIWLPVDHWTGRLHMVGNGAYEPNIYWAQMGDRIRQHDVGIATDTGHAGRDLEFGIGHPEKIIDWGQRAVHESVIAAKMIVRNYYSREANWSYFSGCSTGGEEALSEAQRFPADFNGIIAGDPGNDRTSLNMAFLWQFQKNHPYNDNSNAILNAKDLIALHEAVVGQCDKVDGVADGVINDPRACKLDLNSLQCTGNKQGCFTDAKLAAIREMYAGPRDSVTGDVIYPGYAYGSEGIESRANDPSPGWAAYWANSGNAQEPQRADFFRHWIFNNPNWNWWTFNWHVDRGVALSKMADKVDATNPDLRDFAGRGGKLIMFMGWADPVGSAYEAIDYYRQVRDFTANHAKALNADAETQKFMRLYMVPGMGHCAGGPGATNFSTATRDSKPPVRDATHDMLIAMENWVEKGKPPQTLVATHYSDDHKTVAFQRPLCVFPAVASFKGGDVKEASSFQCERPK